LIRALDIPVRHLGPDEHADHDDQEIDANDESVLVAQVLGDAAQNHS
jgi:hypothetical protein